MDEVLATIKLLDKIGMTEESKKLLELVKDEINEMYNNLITLKHFTIIEQSHLNKLITSERSKAVQEYRNQELNDILIKEMEKANKMQDAWLMFPKHSELRSYIFNCKTSKTRLINKIIDVVDDDKNKYEILTKIKDIYTKQNNKPPIQSNCDVGKGEFREKERFLYSSIDYNEWIEKYIWRCYLNKIDEVFDNLQQ